MKYCIIYHNTTNDLYGTVTDDNGNIDTWDSEDEAERVAEAVPVCWVYPYEVVELGV